MTAPSDGCAPWDLVGADTALATLKSMLAEERLPHALLLSGPRSVGKARLARELACVLNHQESDCGQCRRIRAANHADVEVVAPGGLTLDASSENSRSVVITIGQIRRLEMLAAIHPYEGKHRVFIVDPADKMTHDAADAFLKTLEEPAPFVTFVLVSARPALLSETIRSRCSELSVPPLSFESLTRWLVEDRELEAEQALALARLSRGRVGAAVEALAEDDVFALRRGQIEEIRRLSEQGRPERFKFAEGLAGRGGDPANALIALEHWSAWWRDLLLIALGSEAAITHRQQLDELRESAREYRPADLVRFLLALQSTAQTLRHGASPRLALDVLFTQIPTRRAKPRAEARP